MNQQANSDIHTADTVKCPKQKFCKLTANGGSLWQYSDGSYSSILQLVDGTVFGPPAVRANPQEMTDLVSSLTGIQDPPAFKRTLSLNRTLTVCVCPHGGL